MGLNTNLIWFFILFFLYGIYMASTEGISRAWLSNLCDKKDTGKALGVYAGLSSVLTLLASSVAGFIWYKYNAQTTFFLTAFVTLLVCFYFLVVIKNPTLKKND